MLELILFRWSQNCRGRTLGDRAEPAPVCRSWLLPEHAFEVFSRGPARKTSNM